MKAFRFRDHFAKRLKHVDPNAVAIELEDLAREVGTTAGFQDLVGSKAFVDAMVDRALSDKSCSWRGALTLSRQDAARKCWRQECRAVVQCLEVEAIPGEDAQRHIVFVDPPKTQGRYIERNAALERIDLRHRLVEMCIKGLASLRKRYSGLGELQAIWEAIDEAQDSMIRRKAS